MPRAGLGRRPCRGLCFIIGGPRRMASARRSRSMANTLNLWGGLAGFGAGVLWLLIWLHQRATHGPTATDERRLLVGLTWMDSAKFLVVPLGLLAVAVAILYRHQRALPGRPGRLGGLITGVGLGALFVGVVAEFWTFPWGSYAAGFGAGMPRIGGAVQALASVVFALGFLVFGITLVRAKVIPIGMAALLTVGGLTTFFLTPVSWFPGLVWLLLGVVLWLKQDASLRAEHR